MLSKAMETKIRLFEEAVDQKSWIGSQPPEQHTAIEHQYELAKIKLIQQIEKEISLAGNGSQLPVGNRKTFQQEPVDPKDHR